MVAAAKAIFADMTERGILQELLVQEEEGAQQYSRQQDDGGGGTAGAADQPPPQQGMERAGSGGGQRRPPRAGWKSHFDEEADRRGAVFRFSGRDKPRTSSPQAKGGAGGTQGVGAAPESPTNVQSQEQGGAAGRLWQGTATSALPSGGGGGGIEEGGGGGGGGNGSEENGQGSESPGRRVGTLMRQLIEQDGWQLVVQGHR